MSMAVNDGLSIGALARRTGLAVSAIRYYEAQGLIKPWRNNGGQRRFERADLRRLSFDGRPEAFALEFDDLVTGRLIDRDFETLANRETLGSLLTEAHPSVDHYLPALTIAGASDQRDDLLFMTDSIDLGSISMRSFIFHPK